MGNFTIAQMIAVWALPVIFAITVHEAAHGWVANKLGDDTAKSLGRVTLNPLKHIHWFGTIVLPAILLSLTGFVFGWAKPVPISWNKLKNPRRDMAIVALAGPGANFIMILLWALIAKLDYVFFGNHLIWAKAIAYMGLAGININLILMLLNLIPIPPLDGSRVLYSLLPPSLSEKFQHFELSGLLILILLLFSGLLNPVILTPMLYLRSIILSLFGLS
ncbi:MAG: site-2 protease family protein [Gammaproteobacteria bacterium]|nr:site-2 protease family protein [Gammaproteobacteria bacterium]